MAAIGVSDVFERARTRLRKAVQKAQLRLAKPSIVSVFALPDEAFLALFDLPSVLTPLAQGDVPAAKRALLDRYARRVSSNWPHPPSALTDLRFDADQLSPAAIIDRANAVLDYRIFHDDDQPRLTPQGNVDWAFNPTVDQEWLWRLHRLQWWPVLGRAYALSRDERYAQAFVSQLRDWLASNPLPPRKDERSSAWRLMETAMRLRLSWIPSFALFYRSPSFDEDAKLAMLRSICDHAQFLSQFKTNRNHLLRESNGLAYAAVVFPEFKDASRWEEIALARLDHELSGQFNQDGSHIEVSTGYQWLVVDEFQNAYDLLQPHNLALPHHDLAQWLEKLYQVLANLVRPDGSFPQVNDGFVHWPATLLARAGAQFRRDDFTFIGTAGQEGSAPADTSTGFDDAGLYIMRSDWTKDARYLLFDAGPYGGPHGHEDKLSIEVYAYGQPFIVDSGSYTYDKNDPFRTYFVGSHGHNTVLVDGLSQVRRWYPENLDPQPAQGNYAQWVCQPDFDFVAATYRDGYGAFRMNKPQEAHIVKGVTHTRRVLFVKPDYWLVIDELHASTSHDYQILFHTAPGLAVQHESDGRTIVSAGPDSSRLVIVSAEPQTLQVSTIKGSESPPQGWYSESSKVKTPASVVIYEQKHRASTVIATLLYPSAADQTIETLRIEPLALSGGKGMAFVVTTDSGQDILMLSEDEGSKHFGAYESTALLAGKRLDTQGALQQQFEWPAKE